MPESLNGFHQKFVVLQAKTSKYFGHVSETPPREKIENYVPVFVS